MSTRRAEFLLLLTSLGAVLLLLEVAFRFAFYLRHRRSLESAIARPLAPPPVCAPASST